MKKINIIQFMPYFPPHKGWVETVWEEISDYWVRKWYGEFINVIFDVWQIEINNYTNKWYKVFLLPSFEIIPNFPFPKFWKKNFWLVFLYLKNFLKNSDDVRVISHTRFFISSLIAWIFSKIYNLKWIHIEHWSDYVKLSSKIKSKVSYLYDRIIWKWIFKNSDKIFAISKACKIFINKEFIKKDIEVFYRGVEFPLNLPQVEILSEKFKWKIILWFVWRLIKWKNVESLILAYYNLLKYNINIQLVIVWDWEDFNKLKEMDINWNVYFTWWKNFDEALAYQKQFDIHIHSSSTGWWLATTLIQAMNYGCYIVATPNEWANEVICNWLNWILLENDSLNSLENGILEALNNFDKKNIFESENKKIIKEKFSWEQNILILYNLIK